MHRMTPQLVAAAIAARARLRPRLAAPTAFGTRAAKGNVERDGCTGHRLVSRQSDRGAELLRTLIGKKRLTHAIERHRHRGEIDDDVIGETARLVTPVLGRAHGNLIATVVVECVSPHQSVATMGAGPGEVNGSQGVPDVRRIDADT